MDIRLFAVFTIFTLFSGCDRIEDILHETKDKEEAEVRISYASHPEVVKFSSSSSSEKGEVYEVLPGPAALDPSQSPTPFSNKIKLTTGAYAYAIKDVSPRDSKDSEDAVTSVNITFTGNDGKKYKIDQVKVTHKEEGRGEHTFFGGVGLNKVIHGNTGVGTNLEPKLLAYIALWGVTDIKDATTGDVIAKNRRIHIMTTTRVRDENLNMITSREVDSTDHNNRKAETHIILPPMDLQGNMKPIPGTDHGFIHMMFEEVKLEEPSRDGTLVYEVLPGPAAIDPSLSPTPFSNRVAIAGGSYEYKALDKTEGDSEDSKDKMANFSCRFERADGTVFSIDGIKIIHKEKGSGEHTFFGGIGFDKTIHGNTGVGTNLEPKLLAYVALWGIADLKDGEGNIIASDRMIHVMTTSRVRTEDLMLITSTDTDETDHSPDKIETHVIIPPNNPQGEMDPVPGTGHGFLHLMYEEVSLREKE